MSRWIIIVVLIFSGFSAQFVQQSNPELSPAAVPAGFTQTVVVPTSSLDAPTAFTWLPSGEMLITQQNGELLSWNGTSTRTVMSLGNRVCYDFERGLLGIAVDPQFTSGRPYVYVYYTFNKFNQTSNNCPRQSPSTNPVNRVSRFTWSNNVLDLASEHVLLDNIGSYNGNHNAGDLGFGKDGKLYISVGDGGCDYLDSGCGGANDASREQHTLLGKILRINADGTIPSDNPFLGSGTARCNTGSVASGTICQETWAWGFRNPYRMTFDPNASGVRLFVNDVGQNVREEIDEVVAGKDYGWNCREGTRVNNSTGPCSPTPANMVDPIYEYSHGNAGAPFINCNSITGGAFVPANTFPSNYSGYMFGDYVCGKIFMISAQAPYNSVLTFSDDPGSVTHMAFGPNGGRQALFYATYANGGEIRRISYDGSSSLNSAFTANPSFGAAPLAVTFTASNPSSGASYLWNFGNGTSRETNTPSTSYTYANNGTYTATLYLRGSNGDLSNVSQAIVRVGATAPNASITQPSSSAQFAVGQTIQVRGQASDAEQGQLPASALSWKVILHHDTHTHPYLTQPTTNSFSFTAPAPEDLLAASNSYLELELTATDSSGLSHVVTQTIQPHKVNVTLASTPNANANFVVNNDPIEADAPFVSWENYSLRVTAPVYVDSNRWWRFVRWSDNNTSNPRTFMTPASATTYTAVYEEFTPYQIYLPVVRK